ncbi:MAG: hypothetical protein U0936_13115 [Planctomycetaceae bacterium]
MATASFWPGRLSSSGGCGANRLSALPVRLHRRRPDTYAASGCPLELLPPGAELLPTLGMDRVDAERLRAQLYKEICES